MAQNVLTVSLQLWSLTTYRRMRGEIVLCILDALFGYIDLNPITCSTKTVAESGVWYNTIDTAGFTDSSRFY